MMVISPMGSGVSQLQVQVQLTIFSGFYDPVLSTHSNSCSLLTGMTGRVGGGCVCVCVVYTTL